MERSDPAMCECGFGLLCLTSGVSATITALVIFLFG